MSYQASFGPFLSEEDLDSYGKLLPPIKKLKLKNGPINAWATIFVVWCL